MAHFRKLIYRTGILAVVVALSAMVVVADEAAEQAPDGYRIVDEFSGAQVLYEVDRQVIASPSDCLVFSWSVDRISELHFNGMGVAGQDSRTICGMVGSSPSNATLRVVATDGTEKTYQIPMIRAASYYLEVAFLLSLYGVVLPLILVLIGWRLRRNQAQAQAQA